MKRFLAIFFLLLSLPAQAEVNLQSSLHDIYWMNLCSVGGDILRSDTGEYQYEEPLPASCHEDDAEPAVIVYDSPAGPTRPMVAIVIDDVGLDRKRSARALALPAAVTIAFLPYSPHVLLQARAAREKGHELIVHMPMEPDSAKANPGPDYLGTEQSHEEVRARVVKNLSAFEDYVGVNNHMGSKFTRDRGRMDIVMEELKARGLFFLDSKTVPDSKGERAARDLGVSVTHRDVFLDHVESAERVSAALRRMEWLARKEGSAIAIGHPKDVTLPALEKWLPTLEKKGIELVPVSRIVALRQAAAAQAISQNSSALRLAPPTSTPSTSGK